MSLMQVVAAAAAAAAEGKDLGRIKTKQLFRNKKASEEVVAAPEKFSATVITTTGASDKAANNIPIGTNTVVDISNHMGRAPSGNNSYSIITQPIVTFVTVFFFGCAVLLAVFAWKRFTDSSFR